MTVTEGDIPIDYLRECFDLDIETGTLTWRRRPHGHFPSERVRCSASRWVSRS